MRIDSGETHDMRTYTFHDATERTYSTGHNILDYREDPGLGRESNATILVKWTNQTYHDENLRAMFTPNWDAVAGISRTNSWRHRNRYYAGLIVKTSLGVDCLDEKNAETSHSMSQPTGIDSRKDGLTAYACADKILFSPTGEPDNLISEISHPTFARLHSVEFNQQGDRVLTSSSSLDLIHEVDLDGNITWTLDLWRDTPFNTNVLGQKFFRSKAAVGGMSIVAHNPSVVALKDDEKLKDAVCVLDDPATYDGLGLSTNLTPVFINTAAYGNNGEVLTTSFHRGEAWVINRSLGQIAIAAKAMRNPHGFHLDPFLDGYMVTDTGNERLSFMSSDLEEERTIDFSTLDDRKPGLEKARWLQYVTRLDEALYCAVISPRQKITLFDPARKVRRDIPFDPEWGIQLVAP
ncbi:MAG TPA: hypothetical protein VF733_03500 [Candidatus Saccharimonadales bacterium]